MKPRYYLALYKGHRGGSGWRVWCARATDWLTRILTRGQYSHAEIAYGPVEGGGYDCISSSVRDGGVRAKTMLLPADKWFYSEWYAAALGLPDCWRWSPNDLATIVSVLKRQA